MRLTHTDKMSFLTNVQPVIVVYVCTDWLVEIKKQTLFWGGWGVDLPVVSVSVSLCYFFCRHETD